VKCSKATLHRKTRRMSELRSVDQRLTSFAGLVVYQPLFARAGLMCSIARTGQVPGILQRPGNVHSRL